MRFGRQSRPQYATKAFICLPLKTINDVIGDAVNFVFKLQSLCKPWPNGILISEKTRHACESALHVEEIDHYAADTDSEKTKIYRVLGRRQESV